MQRALVNIKGVNETIVLLLLFNLKDFFFPEGLMEAMLKPGRGLWVRHHVPQP